MVSRGFSARDKQDITPPDASPRRAIGFAHMWLSWSVAHVTSISSRSPRHVACLGLPLPPLLLPSHVPADAAARDAGEA